jgi:hypothetical protein
MDIRLPAPARNQISHYISKTGSVSVLKRGEEDACCVQSLRKI